MALFSMTLKSIINRTGCIKHFRSDPVISCIILCYSGILWAETLFINFKSGNMPSISISQQQQQQNIYMYTNLM